MNGITVYKSRPQALYKSRPRALNKSGPQALNKNGPRALNKSGPRALGLALVCFAALVLSGCVSSRIEQARVAKTSIRSGEAIV
ncbi:MAG: hypothetical protein ACR2PJ_01375, partial [Pseudomonadales bacterium]